MAAAAAAPQQLLGEDGRGYELARRLEACGAWRAWLGEAAYSGFAHSLASPAAWEAFMRADATAGKTRAQIHLQLRARALLFDKASISLFLSPSVGFRSSSSSHRLSIPAAPALANLNPSYLQLHSDDIYFSLEDNTPDGVQHQECSGASQPSPAQSVAQSRAVFGSYYDRKSSVESRYNDAENENMAQRIRLDELPETWYSQYIDRYKKGKPWKFPLGDRESNKRTPDGMSAYMKLLDAHKRKRQAFREEMYMGTAITMRDNGSHFHLSAILDAKSSVDDDTCLLPEVMFPSNCVPDSALPPPNTHEEYQKMDVYGVLDSLPHIMSQSPAMMERFGIRPEYLKVEFGRKYRGKYGIDGIRKLSSEQASQMTQKVIARVLCNVGLEGGTEACMEVLSKFMAAHICKLGRNLKIFTDSYRRQFTSTELLKMFVQTAGLGSFAALADYMKDTSKNLAYQNQQHMRMVQAYPNHLQQQQVASTLLECQVEDRPWPIIKVRSACGLGKRAGKGESNGEKGKPYSYDNGQM
ncbi:hypothetical protein Taro_001308 [Colocasia esculenta]|uniref:Uncharacterized protein n=1 Tax=Colocasia esculenta TaxID=4460 RepID=A0A843TD50_COLES|nr:hypothetical protein [Colocasia esculenta]